jgi:putative ABC transport system permease protein
VWLVRDIRSAFRVLTATPTVSAIAVVSLALGIGASTSIFSLLNGLLFRKIPVVEPDRLVTVTSDFAISRGFQSGAGWNHAMWERLQARSDSFDGALAWMPKAVALGQGAQSDVVNGLFVSGDFFKTLGVPAQYGRVLTGADDVRGGGVNGPVVVVSHLFWERRLARDAHAIGKPLILEGLSFTIVGITPREFLGLEVGQPFDVALPLASEPLISGKDSALLQPSSYLLFVMLRLKPSQSQQSATTLLRRLEPEIAPANVPQFLRPFALSSAAEGTSTPSAGAGGLRQRFRQPLFILMTVVGFVLLIACLNIAHLSMTRAVARHREFAIRFALGASRWRVARQVFVENLTVATAGTAVGVLFAGWASRVLVTTLSNPVREVVLDLSIDWHVVAFAAGTTVATALIFGIAPVLRASRPNVIEALKTESRQASSGGASRFSASLVVTQIAVSLMLVVAGGLLVRTFAALALRPLGFDSGRVLIVRVDSVRSHLTAESRSILFDRLVDAALHLPGVDAAAASAWTPLTGGGMFGVTVAGGPSDTERAVVANFVTPGWFRTYGTPIVAGRDLDARDVATAPPVLLVNEAFVRHFIPGGSPLGVAVKLSARKPDGGSPSPTIVGVAHDAIFRSGGVAAGAASVALRAEIPPMIYLPMAQSAGLRPPGLTSLDISIRSTGGAPVTLAAAVGSAFAAVDPNLLLMIRPLDDYVDAALAEDRIVALLAGFFGAVGLLLAGLGVYGVTSYAVDNRRAELGIRLALGARPSQILQLVLRRVGTLVLIGVLSGTLASLWLTRSLAALLFGLRAHDLLTFSAAALVLALVGGFAAWLPASRAARTDPAIVLRTNH